MFHIKVTSKTRKQVKEEHSSRDETRSVDGGKLEQIFVPQKHKSSFLKIRRNKNNRKRDVDVKSLKL